MNSPKQKGAKTDLARQDYKPEKVTYVPDLPQGKEEVALAIANNTRLFQPLNRPVMTDEECIQILQALFHRCAETGEMITVEKMALALGVNLVPLNNWENKNIGGPRRSEIIKQAKLAIQAIDAELVLTGKIPAVPYIFRAKNYYGMRDQTDVVLTPNDPIGEKASKQELADKYDVIFDQEE